ncbi:AAA family ATPase [Clostridium intestinale]|uniref:Adenylate kinase n=1 Tax=Clostridium intestinale DSM 6191 TaxID=1121320 RepID=A0A1M5WQ92_9CLOT|nr:AAA family ATPase [Clostridium intestinale]SHH89766.1 Adenylate kinase [Clostridium intestinale DSM 6191]
MERIIIIGGNGCGKTTFAKELSDKLNLPLIHLDVLYWRDNWETASTDEFDELLVQEITKPKWIIDGNIGRTIPFRLKYCDTVIYMDFSRLKCVYGVIKRVIKCYGKSRTDMGGYCPEKFNMKKFEFLKSVWNFNKNNRKRYYDMLQSANDVKIIILKSRRQVRELLQQL